MVARKVNHVVLHRKRLSLALVAALALAVWPAALGGSPTPAHASATSLLTESFTHSSASSGWTAGGTACLTAAGTNTGPIPTCSGASDADGSGALQLTNATGYQAGFVINNTPEPAGQGYVVNFNMAAYGGTGADGISFFLVDGSQSPTQVGAYGGGLGYAQRTSNSTNGLVGGYLGIGFDEYGNFANDGDGHGQGCTTSNTTQIPQAVTIRGAGSGLNGYCYITSSGSLVQHISTGTTRAGAERSVRITISPSEQISVAIDFHDGNGYTQVIAPTNFAGLDGQPAFPSTFKFGFASSTGGATNTHDIWGLDVAPDPSNLSVTSTHSDPFTPGTTGTYTLTVQNAATAGPTQGSVVLTDTVPSGLTPVSASGGTDWSCPISGQQVVCTYTGAGIASGASAHTIALQVSVPHNAASATVTNNVTLTAAGDTNASVSASDTTHIVPSATLALSSAAPASVTAGQTLTATATLTNTGPSDAANPVVTYTVPAALSFVSLTNANGWSCDSTPSSGHVSCRAASIAAGATTSFTLVATARSNDAAGSAITSTFAAGSDASSVTTSSQSTSVTTASALALTASAPAQVTAGQNVTYTATLTNTGPSDAASPIVTFTVPAHTTFTSLTGSAGWVCGAPNGQGQATCQTITLAAGAAGTFTMIAGVNSNAANGSTLTANLSASAADTAGATTTAAAATVTTASALTLSALAPAQVTAGTTVTYTATLTNTGPSDAASPIVTFTVPAHTSFVSLSGPAGWTCDSTPSAGAVTCRTATLPSGGTAAFALVTTVNSNTPSGSTLTTAVSGGASDAVTTSTTASATTNATTSSVLSLSALAPTSVNAGQNVTDTATLVNNGPSDAASPAVTFTVPAHTTFTSLAGPAGWTCGTPNGQGQATCQASTLAAGGTAAFTLVGAVNSNTASGSTLTGSVSANATDATGAVTASAGTSVTTVAALSLSALAPASINAGQNITYTATLVNTGPSDAASPIVTFTVPTNTNFVSLTGPSGWSCGTPNGQGQVTCQATTLVAGASSVFTLVVSANSGTPSGSTLSSAISANANDAAGLSATAAGAAVTTASALNVTAQAPQTVVAGQSVTYTATLLNNGPSDAAHAVVAFGVPAHTTFSALTASSGWSCDSAPNGQGQVACRRDTLAVGGSAAFTLVAQVSSNAARGSTLTSTVTATSDSASGAGSASASSSVATQAALAVSASAPTSATSGQNVTDTATVVNNGPSDATNPSVTFTLPANTTFVSLTAPAGWSCDGAPDTQGRISCHASALTLGGTATFSLTFTVNSSYAGGSSLAASVAATSDATADAGTASINGAVTATSSLAVAAAAQASTIQAGQDAVFTVGVTNHGPSDAAHPAVSVTVPSGATIDALDAPFGWSCGAPDANGVVSCTEQHSLAVGTTAAFTLRLHTDAASPAETLTERVTATSDAASAASASAQVSVQALPPVVAVTSTPMPQKQHVDVTKPQEGGNVLSSLEPIEVCVTTHPRATGILSLTVAHLYGHNLSRVVYYTEHPGQANDAGRFCATVNGRYVPEPAAKATLVVAVRVHGRIITYRKTVLLLHDGGQRTLSEESTTPHERSRHPHATTHAHHGGRASSHAHRNNRVRSDHGNHASAHHGHAHRTATHTRPKKH